MKITQKLRYSLRPQGQVGVWPVSLDLDIESLERCRQVLSRNELSRAARYIFNKDRDHYIASRGLLRYILASYLDSEPACLVFTYGPNGKPSLRGTNGEEYLRFSLSHSSGAALIAVGGDSDIGVDLERIRHVPDMEQIAVRIFSKNELASFQTLPAIEKQGAFFRYWTRKEALVKASGDGLQLPLDSLEYSLGTHENEGMLSIDGGKLASSRLFVKDLILSPCYCGALASRGDSFGIKYIAASDIAVLGQNTNERFINFAGAVSL